MRSLLLAAVEAEPSKAPFYVAGGLLVAWAVMISTVGMLRPNFPGSTVAARVVMAVSAALVGVTVASVILTS